MRLYNLRDFKGGWVIGDFIPTIIPLKEAEVCIKRYAAGDQDEAHYHALAEEITIVVSGIVKFNHVTYEADDILLIEKGEIVKFQAITDAITCVIKVPSVKGDKHVVNRP